MFIKNFEYVLIDFEGFQREDDCKLLANYIKETNSAIKPTHATLEGTAVGLQFVSRSNGRIGLTDYSLYIKPEHIKYFRLRQVNDMLQVGVLPKNPRIKDDNILNFPNRRPLSGVASWDDLKIKSREQLIYPNALLVS